MTEEHKSILAQIDTLTAQAVALRDAASEEDKFVWVGIIDTLLEGRRQLAIADKRGWLK